MSNQSVPFQNLEGVIERLTYHNEDNGYTVAKFTPKAKSYQVTVIGSMLGINVGESLRLAGWWTTHPQYGKQFQVEHYTVQLPATIEGIRKYLGSGLIKGIGPKTSSKIVDFFGLETLSVMSPRKRSAEGTRTLIRGAEHRSQASGEDYDDVERAVTY